MKGKMIFIIIAFALIIIVSIGYFVYGNKNTSSKIENIATKEENIVKDIIVTNETTQNTITEIIEQEKTEIEIPEQIEIQEKNVDNAKLGNSGTQQNSVYRFFIAGLIT